jgi:tRNA nucleotidyltransferase (CCA-adding enzyme)
MENLDIFFAVVLMDNKITLLPGIVCRRSMSAKYCRRLEAAGTLMRRQQKLINHTLAQVELMLIEKTSKRSETVSNSKEFNDRTRYYH